MAWGAQVQNVLAARARRRRKAEAQRRQDAYWKTLNGPVLILTPKEPPIA